MRFHTLTPLLLATLAIATPVPSGNTFNEIEKRWAEGHSEVCAASAHLPGCYIAAWVDSLARIWTKYSPQQIHTGLTHRDMTPAWPMHARDGEGSAFATATDERSIEASVLRSRTPSLMEQMREFAERFMRNKGLDTVIARRGVQVEEAPVLKPRKAMRYHFSS